MRSYNRCFLGTETGRIVAIKVYLDFGFCPDLDSAESRNAWEEFASVVEHPILTAAPHETVARPKE